jgi:hypothetical protein
MQRELETYLTKLKESQAEFSTAALTRPKGKEAFDYGEACGTLKGLMLAEQLLNAAIEEVADE